MALRQNQGNAVDMDMSQDESLEEPTAQPESSNTNNGNLEECLKLLRSPIDEQRFVGLLIATKFISGDDTATVKQIFDAIGFDFINRLLKTAESSSEEDSSEKIEQKKAYGQLALAMLSAFSRLPELSSHEQILQKIPFFVSTIQSRTEVSMMKDAYDCLLSISSSENGLNRLKEEEVISVAATDLYLSDWNSPCIPHVLNLMEILFSNEICRTLLHEYKSQFSASIKTLSKIFCERNDSLKFQSLHILLCTLSSDGSDSIREQLSSHKYGNEWSMNIKMGVSQIFHSKIDPEKKYMALKLSRIMTEIEGTNWLIICISSSPSSVQDQIYSAERFFVLLVETLRIEIHILLNDIEHLLTKEAEEKQIERERIKEKEKEISEMDFKEEDEFVDDVEMNDAQIVGNDEGKHPSTHSLQLIKLRNYISDCYSMLEHVIGLLTSIKADEDEDEEKEKSKEIGVNSSQEDAKDRRNENEIEMKEGRDLKSERRQFFSALGEENLGKIVLAVDDIISNILEFVDDMKKLGNNQELAVLASVRVLGRFLAEAPATHSKTVKRLLSFMLSVKSQEETTPIESVRFLLPFLSQVSLDADVCKRIIKDGGHKSIVGFISEYSRTSITGELRGGEEAHGYLIQACDVILNIFGTREDFPKELDVHDFSPLLASMVSWSSARGSESNLILGLCSCIIASILDLSSESTVKSRLDNASYKRLRKSMETIVKFLEIGNKTSSHFGQDSELRHLWDITVSSCTGSLDNWPMLKRAIHDSPWWTKMSKAKPMTASRLRISCKDAIIKPLMAAVAGVKLEAVLTEPKSKSSSSTTTTTSSSSAPDSSSSAPAPTAPVPAPIPASAPTTSASAPFPTPASTPAFTIAASSTAETSFPPSVTESESTNQVGAQPPSSLAHMPEEGLGSQERINSEESPNAISSSSQEPGIVQTHSNTTTKSPEIGVPHEAVSQEAQPESLPPSGVHS